MEPDEKPKLGKIEEVVRNLIAITCEGQDYDYILPADLVERLNSAIHKAIKPLIPKRYRFTTQSFIFPRDGQVPITLLLHNYYVIFTTSILRSYQYNYLGYKNLFEMALESKNRFTHHCQI